MTLQEMVEQYIAASKQEKEAKKIKDMLKKEIKAKMIEEDLEDVHGNGGRVTRHTKYTTKFRSDVDMNQMIEKYGDVDGFITLKPEKLNNNAEAVESHITLVESEYIRVSYDD